MAKKATHQAHKLFESVANRVGYLRDRWQHEKAHEDWNDYLAEMVNLVPEGVTFLKGSKRPFGFNFSYPDGTVWRIKATSRRCELELLKLQPPERPATAWCGKCDKPMVSNQHGCKCKPTKAPKVRAKAPRKAAPTEGGGVDFNTPEPTDLAVELAGLNHGAVQSSLLAKLENRAPTPGPRRHRVVDGCKKIAWTVRRDSEGAWIHLVGGLDLKKTHHTALTFTTLRSLGFQKDEDHDEWAISHSEWRESARDKLASLTGLNIKRSK